MSKTTDSVKKGSRIKRAFGKSVIFSALNRFSEWICKKINTGIIGGIFTAYKHEESAANSSMIAKGIKKLDASGRAVMPIKRKFAHAIETSAVLASIRHMLDSLLYSSMRSYGIFMFSASLYSAIAYIFHILYFKDLVFELGSIIVLVGMMISSVMMISSRHTLATALVSSPTSRFVLFKVIGLRTETFEKNTVVADKFNVPFIAGLVFGILSFFVQPITLLLTILVIAAAYSVLVKPEFGVLAILAALPFMPIVMLAASLLYTAICFFIKVMRGKRSIKLDLVDGMVLLFMILMVLGGIVSSSADSIHTALIYCVFMFGYFLIVNLIRLKEWVMKCVAAVILSCTGVALYGLYQHFFGLFDAVWQIPSFLPDASGRVVSAFNTTDALAKYLVMVIPLIFAAIIVTKSARTRFALVCALLFSGGCLICTWTRGAWLGFIIAILLFLLMYNHKTLTVLMCTGFAVPFLSFLLPQNVVDRFMSIAALNNGSAVYRANLWSGVCEMLKDHWLGGVGIGEDAFTKTYRLYALSGYENAVNAQSLYLQILVGLGIVGLALFLLTMFVWTQSCFELHVSEKRSERLYSSALFCSVFAVLIQGVTDYIWHDYRVFLMFWLIIGLACAVRKTLKSTEPDEII